MENNLKEFNRGLELLVQKKYEEAIEIFKKDISLNPENLESYNNIGVAQTYLGIINQDMNLLTSDIQHFEKAIAIAKEFNYKDGYPSAENNLKWAKDELFKLK